MVSVASSRLDLGAVTVVRIDPDHHLLIQRYRGRIPTGTKGATSKDGSDQWRFHFQVAVRDAYRWSLESRLAINGRALFLVLAD